MKLVLDLAKASTLDTSKLIQKPVLVRGNDGRVFTRKQWVSPGESPTSDKDKKPKKVDEPKKPKSIDSSIANTPKPKEEPSKAAEIHDKATEQKVKTQEDIRIIDMGNDPISKDSSFTTKEFINNYSKDPMVDYIIKESIHKHESKESNPKYILSELRNKVSFRDIKAVVSSKINQSTHDIIAKHMQKQALENGHMNHSLSMAGHPDIAREVVNKVLGKELADSFRNDMAEANISINFPSHYKEVIEEKGYFASTPEKYIKDNMSDESMDAYNEILNGDYESESERIEALFESDKMENDEVYVRANAEHEALGIKLEDFKPTYMAFNAVNNPTGGAKGYGARWMKVQESTLRNSTVTLDDTFHEKRSFAKVWDIDHLKDIFILKSVEMYRGLDIRDSQNNGSPWYARASLDIPLEIQLHERSISPRKFDIQYDPAHDLDDDDYDYETFDDLDLDDLDELDLDDKY